jgi:hypothetical protein
LTYKSGGVSSATSNEIARGPIPSNESLVALDHPNTSGKLTASGRPLA